MKKKKKTGLKTFTKGIRDVVGSRRGLEHPGFRDCEDRVLDGPTPLCPPTVDPIRFQSLDLPHSGWLTFLANYFKLTSGYQVRIRQLWTGK